MTAILYTNLKNVNKIYQILICKMNFTHKKRSTFWNPTHKKVHILEIHTQKWSTFWNSTHKKGPHYGIPHIKKVHILEFHAQKVHILCVKDVDLFNALKSAN